MYLENAVPFSYLGYISRRIFASLIPSNKGNSPFLFGRRVSAEFVLYFEAFRFFQLLLLFFPPSYSTTNPNSPVFLCFT